MTADDSASDSVLTVNGDKVKDDCRAWQQSRCNLHERSARGQVHDVDVTPRA